MTDLRATWLCNGYIRVDCYLSGLVGLYNADGSYRHGDLRLRRSVVLALVGGAR